MAFESSEHRIVSVVLSYNSDSDVKSLVPQLQAQRGIHHSVIIVDNASTYVYVERTRSWLQDNYPNAVIGTVTAVQTWMTANPELAREHHGRVYLVLNHENGGYSAGNNIGIRLADELQADAVLIANPDMRVEDPHYLLELSKHLFSDKANYIAASRILSLAGEEQNPLREASFWEELLWPRFILRRIFKPSAYVISCPTDKPSIVPKVSGCCLMLRMTFLSRSNYLDEKVFLYCEEPILAARVKAYGGKVVYVPMVRAVHAHIKGKKDDSTKRMFQFIKSRKYYLKNYSGYNGTQLSFLAFSYALLIIYNHLKYYSRSIFIRYTIKDRPYV